MKMEYVLQSLILRRVRHSRMLLAGIQAEFGLDPRLKHSGVTVLGVASLDPSQIFEGAHEDTKDSEIDIFKSLNFVTFVVQSRFRFWL
jgi:hypothetical protein